MRKKTDARLCELVPAASGDQDAMSLNLASELKSFLELFCLSLLNFPVPFNKTSPEPGQNP